MDIDNREKLRIASVENMKKSSQNVLADDRRCVENILDTIPFDDVLELSDSDDSKGFNNFKGL